MKKKFHFLALALMLSIAPSANAQSNRADRADRAISRLAFAIGAGVTDYVAARGASTETANAVIGVVANFTFSIIASTGADRDTMVAAISGFIAGTSRVVTKQGLDPDIVSGASYAGGSGPHNLLP